MAAKIKKPSVVEKTEQAKAETEAERRAKLILLPSLNAAAVVAEYSIAESDILALMNSLSESIEQVCDGDMKQCKSMLLGQSYALQAIFVKLSSLAVKQKDMKNYETFLRLALKAQGQCRSTVETLADIINPPLVFAKQANIAHGHQQVNNEMSSSGGTTTTHAGKVESEQNELLEVQHDQRLDTGTTSAAICADSAMATLETGDRPAHGGRKDSICKKR